MLETHKDIHCMLSHKALLLFTVDYLSNGNYKDFHPLFYEYKNVTEFEFHVKCMVSIKEGTLMLC